MSDGSFNGIDLNTADDQPRLHDLDDLKRKLADRAYEIFPPLFPHAHLRC